ncbi:drug resistance transporter, EmrB/QacA subfamily [Jatrophihabitans endophyticus]|uniref:Drug resistance transporter, EmrB/QacA subfamily n=1 Tax=Jatrophihabitans endophyticus TaxID=1206085 RepID=A0A1M5K7Q6_9ACTN|nr:MFS transporter [Jatrophihabitans endophyticus]SHG48630.1 drug resistance transporter, EmrB/QacA subfamily [Jatrophihabitans endophyticus]
MSRAPTSADPGAPADLDPRRWFVLGVCISALFMTLLDATIVNVALPSIGQSLSADAAELQWVVSGYALAFGMVPIIAGRLGDDRGRRRMLLLGIGGFVLTSLLAGLAPTPQILLVARILQGLAGGLVNPQVSGLVQQMFPVPERGRAFGLLGLNVGLAQAVGPVLGGLIIAVGGVEFGWRLTFLVNVPVGVLAFVLAWRLLPRDRVSEQPRRLDLPGAALLALGLGGVLYPVVEYDADRNAARLALLAPALVVVGAFVWWERGPGRRRGHPLIDTSLFRVRSYAGGLGLALLYFAGFFGTSLVLSLFLQDGLGFSALQAGLTASAFAAGLAVGAPIAGRLVAGRGRSVLVVALVLFLAGIVGTLLTTRAAAGHLGNAEVALLMAPTLFLAGLGGGGVITPNQSLSLAEIDVSGGSTAGGMLQTAQRVGAAVGAAVLTAVFYGQLAGTEATGERTRAAHYGHAYAAALLVTVVMAAAALLLAVGEVRRARRG